MNDTEYRALFVDMATYRAPDGAIVLATWTGNMPYSRAHPSATWILTPGHQSGLISHYEVKPGGAVVLHREGQHQPSATDLTVDDFVRAE